MFLQYTKEFKRGMKNKYNLFVTLKNELESYEKQGTKISFKGEYVPAEYAAMMCAFREKSSFMRDYIFDDKGKITEVRFDQIRLY